MADFALGFGLKWLNPPFCSKSLFWLQKNSAFPIAQLITEIAETTCLIINPQIYYNPVRLFLQ